MGRVAVLTGGGTAGHIYPALALAEELADRGFDVYYAGTPTGVEARIVPDAGIEFRPFTASGFDRAKPTSLISGVARVIKSTKAAKKWFSEIHPDVVIGFGGYVSIPVARAAEQMGIPTIVHEQNSVMGMANKYIAKRACKVCLTYDEAAQALDAKSPCIVTGNPVRSQITAVDCEQGRAYLGIPSDARMLLVFGGSLGARHINEAVYTMKDELLARPDVYVVHITGPKELDAVTKALSLTDEEAKRYLVFGYQDRMPEVMSAADLIVSRAGATSLAEISAKGIPAILVPYPHATGDHQTTNARAYVACGAARMFADSDVDSDEFRECVLDLLDDADARARMREAALAQETVSAARALADVVAEAIS